MIELWSGATLLERARYTRDAAGRIVVVEELDARTGYAYDAAGRLSLSRVDRGGAVLEERYTYDASGRRTETTRTTPSGTTRAPVVYGPGDRLVSSGTTSYAFDASGRMLSRSGADGFVLEWDSEDRLIGVTHASGSRVSHEYDADGSLMWTRAGSASTRHVVDRAAGEQALADVRGPGDAMRQVWLGDRLLAIYGPGGARYAQVDHLGSVRSLYAPSGPRTDRYAYGAFGALLSHEGSSENRYLFAGQRFDATGRLSYNRARWMEPRTGRFVSVDPILWLGETDAYEYAGGDPVQYVDPSGLMMLNLIGPFWSPSAGSCLSSWAAGDQEHERVGRRWLRKGPPEDTVPGLFAGSDVARLKNSAITTILQYRRWRRTWPGVGPSLIGGLTRPDLSHRQRVEFYEIKNDNLYGLSTGVTQLRFYQDVFDKLDPYGDWRPGLSFDLSIAGGDLRYGAPGLILYCLRSRPEPDYELEFNPFSALYSASIIMATILTLLVMDAGLRGARLGFG